MRTRLVQIPDIASSLQEPWADPNRRPYVTGNRAYIPVRNGYEHSHIIPERYRSGRGYQKLGDVIIFHGSRPNQGDIAEVIEHETPKGILWISGHEGEMRKPAIELLYGTGGEVIHRESGIQYLLDVQQVMFSQGNRGEKARISALVRPGERIGDMFAGIGYFTLGMARKGASIHAMEINPVSFRYLEQNIRLNRLSANILASLGNCRDLMTGIYDRIHMGHFHAISYLPTALDHARTGTVLHVHMLNDRSGEISDIVKGYGFYPDMTLHKVKKAGPRVWHIVCDLVIR